ncbi:hypothetical protein PNQ69_13700 [Xanthomonas sp. A2111]|uniref:Uncharacterized protein n=1 Tax=Xanthomonas hawaiiensis TaxID=3003247 RepID=A0ABU2I6Q7_9XANT|nr:MULTISPECIES: hypothetical protein [unclassified Xanthomonas]MDS9993829.1 hypothetical protein [Xanthomonas sp. A2111]WNH45563.1 hypothetical protein PG878_03585 [Xanthomonas sp. A6251]
MARLAVVALEETSRGIADAPQVITEGSEPGISLEFIAGRV